MNSYLHLLIERDFLVVAFSAIASFATIVTLGLPYMSADRLETRMKAVTVRRAELRQKQLEALAQGQRNKPAPHHIPVDSCSRWLTGSICASCWNHPACGRNSRRPAIVVRSLS